MGDIDARLTEVGKLVRQMIQAWKHDCHDGFQYAFQTCFGADPFGGHRRHGRLTWHEALWGAWMPHLEQQVTIGTGRGGLGKWGTTSFTVDFLDREGRTVYELDGPSHRGPEREARDNRKDAFLTSLGLEVLRVQNYLVEEMAEEALMHVAKCNLGAGTPDRELLRRAKPLLSQVKEYREALQTQ